MHVKTRLKSRYLCLCLIAVYVILVGVSGVVSSAHAQSQSGLDTQGKTELPLAVEGQIGLELLQPGTGPSAFPTNPPVVFVPGLVSIGTITPIRALTVVGETSIVPSAGNGFSGFLNISDSAGGNGQNYNLIIRGLNNSGTVGVNLATIQLAANNVISAGPITPGSSNVTLNGLCNGYPEGAMGYDTISHNPVYCYGTWQKIGGGNVRVLGQTDNVSGQTGNAACTAIGKTCVRTVSANFIKVDVACPSGTHCMHVCAAWYNTGLPGVAQGNELDNVHDCNAPLGEQTTYLNPGVVRCNAFFSAICQ